MLDINTIDETYSDNPITNIIHSYHINKEYTWSEDNNLVEQIEKLEYKREKLAHPTELDNFIKPLMNLVTTMEYTISTFYLIQTKSNAYRINFIDGKNALFYHNKWGDLCISGKEICEMTEQELSDAVNKWVPTDTDPQMPKVY